MVPGFSLPFEGPLSAGETLDSAASTLVGGFVAQHDKWAAHSGVAAKSPIVYEHQTICRALQYGVTWDRLNLRGMAWAEYLLRRKQLQEDVVAENPTAPNFEGSQHYMGVDDRPGSVPMAPSLKAHVAKQMAAEAAILKERRKAQDARGGRGRGKGKGKAKDEPVP